MDIVPSRHLPVQSYQCEICSKLTLKTPERSVSIVDFEKVNTSWCTTTFLDV